MANKKKGFIPVYRSIQDNWVWDNDEPFSKGQAWIDLLLSVNHEARKIKVGCTIRTIKAGQMWTSYKKLSKKWGWSYKRVTRYIKMLKSDGMIDVDATTNGTLLTVINWASFAYQGRTLDLSDDLSDDPSGDLPDDLSGDLQTIINNNYNNYKNVNNKPSAEPPLDGGDWQ